MHNCIKTKEQIIELLLDGSDRPRDLLSTELHACRECSAEFDSLNATLRITSRLKETATLSERYWTSYHARLREKLVQAGAARDITGPSRLITFFKSSIRVPVPIAAAIVIACLVLFLLSFRKTERPEIQSPSVVHVPVEVPVVQEKIVTRVVYKERPLKNPTRPDRNRRVENPFARSRTTEPNLNGFKPAEDVKLVVIKGGTTYDK